MIDLMHNPHAIQWLILFLRITLLLIVVRVAGHLFRNRNPRWQILVLRAGVAGVVLLPMLSAGGIGWGPRVGRPAYPQLYAELHNQPAIKGNDNSETSPKSSKANNHDTPTPSAGIKLPGVETSWPVEKSPSLIYQNLFQRVVYLVGIGYLAIALVRLMRLGFQWYWLKQMLGKAQPADSQVSTFCAAVANRWQLKRCPPRSGHRSRCH